MVGIIRTLVKREYEDTFGRRLPAVVGPFDSRRFRDAAIKEECKGAIQERIEGFTKLGSCVDFRDGSRGLQFPRKLPTEQ